MKRLISGVAAAIIVFIAACSNSHNTDNNSRNCEMKVCNDSTLCCNATEEQLAGIRKTIDMYIDAAVKGNSDIAKPAFADTATMSYAHNDTLVSVPIKVLYDYYDNDCPQEASYEISACSVAADAAIVRIESIFGGTKFSDMFSMVKDGSDWKIVSKIYHVNP